MIGLERRSERLPKAICLYLFGALIVLTATFSWIVLDALKYRIADATRAGVDLKVAALGAIDLRFIVLVSAICVLAALFILLEIRFRSLTSWFTANTRPQFMMFIVIVLFWFAHCYFHAGLLLSGDTGAHITQVAHFMSGLNEGRLLSWDNYFYLGSPFLQFYGPVFYWIAGTAAWLVGDPTLGVKLCLFALHIASGIAFFLFMRTLGFGAIGAVIGMIAYAGAWAHLHLLIAAGALPQAVTMALLPAAFYFAERMMFQATRTRWAAVGLALVCAGLIANHLPHAAFSAMYLVLYVLARIIPVGDRWRAISSILGAGLVGCIIGAFAVVPFVIEGHEVMMQGAPWPVSWRWPAADYFARMLIWGNTRTSFGNESIAYIGLTVAALAAIALMTLFLASLRRWRGLASIFVVILLLSFVLRGPYVRDVVFTLFAVSALSGLGYEVLKERFWRAARLPVIVLALVFIDLAPTAIQPLARTDKAYLEAAGVFLSGHARGERTMLTRAPSGGTRGDLRGDIGPVGTPITYQPVQILFGPHNLTSTHVHNYAVGTIKRAELDLRTRGDVSESTATLLALFNVSRIVNDGGTGMGLPPAFERAETDGPLGRVLRIAGATPVVFAPSLIRLDPQPQFDKPAIWAETFDAQEYPVRELWTFLAQWAEAMRLDLPNRAAEAIPVRTGQEMPSIAPATAQFPAPSAIAVREYDVRADHVHIVFETRAAGFVQLAHPFFPRLVVTQNGKRIHPLQGTTNLMVIPVEAGATTVEIKQEVSSLRLAMNLMSGAVLLIVLAWPMLKRGRPVAGAV